jgi:hypothetical protein
MSEKLKLPNEELTEIVTDKLAKENLVPKKRLEEIKQLISQGNVKQEDWRSWVELSLAALEQEDKDEQ